MDTIVRLFTDGWPLVRDAPGPAFFLILASILATAIVVSLYFKGVVSTQRERIELVKDRNDALEKEIVGLKADVERFKRQASHYPPMDRIIQVEEIRATTSSVESHIRNIEDIVRQVGTTLGKKDENGR
jgi:hypothetical protein